MCKSKAPCGFSSIYRAVECDRSHDCPGSFVFFILFFCFVFIIWASINTFIVYHNFVFVMSRYRRRILGLRNVFIDNQWFLITHGMEFFYLEFCRSIVQQCKFEQVRSHFKYPILCCLVKHLTSVGWITKRYSSWRQPIKALEQWSEFIIRWKVTFGQTWNWKRNLEDEYHGILFWILEKKGRSKHIQLKGCWNLLFHIKWKNFRVTTHYQSLNLC